VVFPQTGFWKPQDGCQLVQSIILPCDHSKKNGGKSFFRLLPGVGVGGAFFAMLTGALKTAFAGASPQNISQGFNNCFRPSPSTESFFLQYSGLN
jgi:hypothetical protein